MPRIEAPCDCAFCKHAHEFDLTPELIGAFLSGKAALFVGAGVSTESRNVLPITFYDMVAEELGEEAPKLSFPELMSKLCEQINGRYRLLTLLQKRFDTIDAFPELYETATRFHQALGTFYPVKTIVTTNWDTYFEDVCKATPFVSDADLAFWDESDRRVLKIHGSIRSYGSIIADSIDYERCEKELSRGIVGSILKTILATKTLVFIGYSMRDPDFQNIYGLVKEQMKGLHKQAYIVTPFEEEAEGFKAQNLIPIITSGEYFIQQVKRHAASIGAMLPDTIYDVAGALLELVRKEHRKLFKATKCIDAPQVIFAACYQDGMMHALERAIQMRGSGEYSHACRLRGMLDSYVRIQREKVKKKQYSDVAYIEGYVNAITFMLIVGESQKSIKVPLYFAFGDTKDIFELDEFLALLPELPKKHISSYRKAKAMVGRLADPANIEFHHPPWLN